MIESIEPCDIVRLKLETLHSLQSIGMTWWASSTVLCAAILSALWVHRESLGISPLLNSMKYAICFFFGSIVAFGLSLTIHSVLMRSDILNSGCENSYIFAKEFLISACGYGIASTSFFLALISLIYLVKHIRKSHLIKTD